MEMLPDKIVRIHKPTKVDKTIRLFLSGLKALLILITVCIMPCVAQSQSTIKTLLSQQENGYSKGILELLINLNEINPGTKIAPVVRTAIAKDTNLVRSEADTTTSKDRIKKLYETSQPDEYRMEVELRDDNQRIEIAAFNMLGKKVKVFFNDQARKDGEYTLNTSDMPTGMYLCIVQGENVRLREKFIVSR
jgi:hypothetical protein